MSKSVFQKPFTQQEGMPEEAIASAVEILRGGRLHRYNTLEGEVAEAALLEEEYADFQGSRLGRSLALPESNYSRMHHRHVYRRSISTVFENSR